jgi:6-phosphogluconate dehydrogenase
MLSETIIVYLGRFYINPYMLLYFFEKYSYLEHMRRKEAGVELGIVGLGRMGGDTALQALSKGMKVVGMSHPPIREDLKDAGLIIVEKVKDLVASLEPSRKIILYVPAGSAVDSILDEISGYLEPGDLVMDGGNSYYRDSAHRQKRLSKKGIGFVDVGSSGGPAGALHGACFMVGGMPDAVQQAEPILKQLAVPEGFLYAGPPGAGHFVKLIHNAIEFGMLQAIGEGVSLLKQGDYDLDLAAIFHNWAHGSVIRGWLVELMEQGLKSGLSLEEISPYVEDTGEVNWVLEEAICREIPIPVISQAVWALMKSRDEKQYASRTVSLLRHEFGEHPFGPNPSIANERRTGKVTQDTCKTGEFPYVTTKPTSDF